MVGATVNDGYLIPIKAGGFSYNKICAHKFCVNENGDLRVNPHLTGGEIHHQISESLNMHDISHRMLFYILSSSLVDSNWRWFPDLECIPSPLAIHLSSSGQKGDKGQGMGGKFFELKSREYKAGNADAPRVFLGVLQAEVDVLDPGGTT